MHEDRSSCMYYLICDLMQLHVLYYMHLVDMHYLDLHVLLNPNAFLAHRRDPRTVKWSDTPEPLLKP
jgi:hypothetical protein